VKDEDIVDVDQSRDQMIYLSSSGERPTHARVTCPRCHGIPGQFEDTSHPARPLYIYCPRCEGSGKIIVPIEYGEGSW